MATKKELLDQLSDQRSSLALVREELASTVAALEAAKGHGEAADAKVSRLRNALRDVMAAVATRLIVEHGVAVAPEYQWHDGERVAPDESTTPEIRFLRHIHTIADIEP